MAKEECKLHIAMFPWLAFGHMIPSLNLAKLIAQRGHRISFISTPRNIDRFPKLPPHLSSLITFVKLPLPLTEHLPEDAQATIGMPPNKVPRLKNAHDRLQDSITHFLQSSRPDWIIQDFAAYWLPDIARNLGVRSAFFSIYLAATVTFSGPTLTVDSRKKPEDFTVSPNWVPFPTKVAFHHFEVLRIFDSLSGADGAKPATQSFLEVLRGVDVVAIKSCYEFEPEWFQLLEDMHKKPIFPVGVIAPKLEDNANQDDDKWRPIKEWLDKQAERSVVYIAFGTEAKIRNDELTEIAYGLELSGLPFFWVLRIDDDSELPEGFEERVKGRGIVCTTWAPQMKILAHDSIGGFLTHSGWGSVVEALLFERPLVLLTIDTDQGLNARLFEEKKIGFPIPRDHQDGSFTRQSVADALRLVVVMEEGKVYRDKAKEMSRLIGDRDMQEKYIDKFLAHLTAHRPPMDAKDQDGN
ncbi:hypothetical protein FNV43_RR17464 [Rhamnella rubrinervis]|uniref:Uncharacterized protein n=1 Tax=Rhamnella rubrinervis TaxID=2594499 RepID=A0A8K0E484_9ROSA|nr:hypothetical protein FNV43_RR17464 [Rhamnella rubrinervis]